MGLCSSRDLIRRSLRLAVAGLLLLTACRQAPSEAPGEIARPNLVLIVVDTLRADYLRSYGFAHDTAPELDALAERGVRFSRVIAQSSWTRPSIGSMLTSQYPRTLGIYDERREILADRFVTLAETLARAGYTNLAATANPNTNTAFNFQQGFHGYVDSNVRFSWMKEADGDLTDRLAPLHGARHVFRALLDRARTLDSSPIHLMATVMDVHEAFDPRVDLTGYSTLFRELPEHRYLQAIRMVSREIARFMEELGRLPGWEDTIFVVTSDHGQGLASHPAVDGAQFHGHVLYESQILVPWIMASTAGRLPAGRVVDRPVRLLDLAPTLLEVVGVEAPARQEGRSLVPLIAAEADSWIDEPLVVETQFRKSDSIGLYGREWNYFEHRTPRRGTDPRELQAIGGGENGTRTNRLAEHSELVAELAARLAAWEESHPSAEPTLRTAPLDDDVARQLRSLGYVD